MSQTIAPKPSSDRGEPLVSIIIPCYNAAPMIERCVRSCMTQSYPNLEVILVDNNSTDGSIELARRVSADCGTPVHLRPCPEQGQNHSRRHGYACAAGQYIQWLDADDELTQDKIATQVAVMQSRPDVDIAYGDWIWRFHRDGRAVYEATFRSGQFDDYLMQLLIDNWRPMMTYLLRRSAADRLAQLEAWDLQSPCMTDREYFSIAAVVGMRFGYVPDATSVYNHWSKHQITGSVTGSQRAWTARRLFDRLGRLAQEQPADRLHDHHHLLLAQDWDRLRAAPVRIEHRDNALVAVLLQNGDKSIQLTRPQARALQAVAALKYPTVAETHARQVCRHLWRYVVAKWNVDGGPPDFAGVTRVMAKLVGLTPQEADTTAIPAIPDQTVQSDVIGVSRLLNTGMIFLPTFATIRIQLRVLFNELDALGLLVRVED